MSSDFSPPRRRRGPFTLTSDAAAPPSRFLGLYRLLTRKKRSSSISTPPPSESPARVASSPPSSGPPSRVPSSPSLTSLSISQDAPRRKSSGTIGRFLWNTFRRSSTSSRRGSLLSGVPGEAPVSPTQPAPRPRRALSLRSNRPTATMTETSTDGHDAESDSGASGVDDSSLTSLRQIDLPTEPERARFPQHLLDTAHSRSASLPISALHFPQERFSLFIFGCLFKQTNGSRDRPREYLTYFCKATDVQLKFYLSDVKGESPVFSILLTELDTPVEKVLDAEDGAGTQGEKSCSLYSHGELVADLIGPISEMDTFMANLASACAVALDIVMATAFAKTGLSAGKRSKARSLKDTYELSTLQSATGGYSFVRSATNRVTGDHVVLKFLPKSKNRPHRAGSNGNVNRGGSHHSGGGGVPFEITVLSDLHHECIVELLCYYESADYFVLVMPQFGPGRDLFDHISDVDRLSESDARTVLRQVARAIMYLFDRNIIHGDLKDENIIVDPDTMAIKLIDFGSSRTFVEGEPFISFVGTQHISSPEVVRRLPYMPVRQELWSMGVLLYIMLTGEYPFVTQEDIADGVRKGIEEEVKAQVSEEAWDLVDRLLADEPEDQIKREELLQHPWLKE